ncbi:alpha-mannosidase [Anaeramoeba flamelloides]|uniref:Alpha-mannosidase n=1 Tax=Anaeramoeba flamelloides TaxID=1746091 RepID=A0ABQ8YX42_9EUKA|nr:alpha-mannosidase [Anaeramoeba flamelloides]
MKITLVTFFVFFAFSFVQAKQESSGLVTVHLVPHAHCDVGWIETPEDYYATEIAKIMNNVVEELTANPDYRFIWVEVWFIQEWWQNSTQLQRDQFVNLVHNGQLELVLGGIVMTDEALVTYWDAIDQLTEGHTWLRENIVPNHPELLPKYAWHIDPFGASSWTPTLFSDSCFDGYVTARINYLLLKVLKITQEMDFIWKGLKYDSGSGRTHVPWTLGHLLHHGYGSPPHCNWGAHDPEKNPPVTPQNISTLATDLVSYLRSVSHQYQGNLVLQTFGHDRAFQNASIEFGNMTLLVNYINANQDKFNMKIKYSTLRETFDDLYSRNLDYPVSLENFDFFPYQNSKGNHFWTGYYSNVPKLKGMIRSSSSILRTLDFFWSLSGIKQAQDPLAREMFENIIKLRKEVSIAQHHDTITGTSPPPPLEESYDNLSKYVLACGRTLSWLMNHFQKTTNIEYSWDVSTLANSLSISKQAYFVAMNNLGWDRKEWITLDFEESNITFDLNNLVISYFDGRLIDQSDIAIIDQKLFLNLNINPLGYETFFIRLLQTSGNNHQETDTIDKKQKELEKKEGEGLELEFEKGEEERKGGEEKERNREGENEKEGENDLEVGSPLTIDNQYFQIFFDKTSGKLIGINNIKSGIHVPLSQDFYYYRGKSGYTPWKMIVDPTVHQVCSKLESFTYKSSTNYKVQEVKQQFSSYLKQIYRIYDDKPFVEIEMIIGPTPVPYQLFSRFNTDWMNNKYFYSDSFGFQLFEKYQAEDPEIIGSAYRPMTHTAAFRNHDESQQITIISDRAHGVGSYYNGGIEIMYSRNDNYKKYGYYWDHDEAITRQFNWLTFDTIENEEKNRQKNALLHNHQFNLMFSSNSMIKVLPFPSYSGLKFSLPDYLHFLTWKSISQTNNDYWLRLQNIITPETANSHVKVPITVNLSDYLLDQNKIQSSTETSLTGLYDLDSCNKKQWGWKEHPFPGQHNQNLKEEKLDHEIEVVPGEIRTFKVTI